MKLLEEMEKSAEGDPRLQTRRQQQGDDPYSLKELLGIQVSWCGSIIRIHLGCVVDQTRPAHMKSVRLIKAGRRQLFLDVVGLSPTYPAAPLRIATRLKTGKRMYVYIIGCAICSHMTPLYGQQYGAWIESNLVHGKATRKPQIYQSFGKMLLFSCFVETQVFL